MKFEGEIPDFYTNYLYIHKYLSITPGAIDYKTILQNYHRHHKAKLLTQSDYRKLTVDKK